MLLTSQDLPILASQALELGHVLLALTKLWYNYGELVEEEVLVVLPFGISAAIIQKEVPRVLELDQVGPEVTGVISDQPCR
jgi:hypothetical protein